VPIFTVKDEDFIRSCGLDSLVRPAPCSTASVVGPFRFCTERGSNSCCR
jgi:hypothetical protein